MRRFILCLFIAGLVCFVSTTGRAAGSDSPVGTWAAQIVGNDHGVCYLSFSNDLTVTGYGITLDALGPLNIGGTWDFDSRHQLVGGFTKFVDSGSAGAKFFGRAHNAKLRLHVSSTSGRFNLKGEPAGNYADLAGAWNAKVHVNRKRFFVTYSAALSTNTPAWFDLSGAGTDNIGLFTVSGGLVVTPSNRLAAYIVNDYGTTTLTSALIGKLNAKGNKLILQGHTEDHKRISIRATYQQPG